MALTKTEALTTLVYELEQHIKHLETNDNKRAVRLKYILNKLLKGYKKF